MELTTCEKNQENDSQVDENSSATITKTLLPQPMTELLPPKNTFFIDQMKNGQVICKQPIFKNRVVIGRARDSDIIMDHPSISRYHATLLWSPKNDDQFKIGLNKESFWYLVDCGSTHGTVCNKTNVEAGKMIKIIPNNNIFKFGASTRLFSLCSNENNDDEDNEEEIIDENFETEDRETEVSEVCTWGMLTTSDYIEESEESDDSLALKSIISAMKNGVSNFQTLNENVFVDNPTKCLQQWFEREGFDFDYNVDTINNKFKCTFELPINSQWIPMEGNLMTKKKEAISDACLKCCKLLDQACLLFPWQKQKSERTRKKFDNDDDDELYDETVKVNKKIKTDSSSVENFESLQAKWKEINEELCKAKVRLATIGLEPGTKPELPDNLVDSLDIYLATMSHKKYGLSMNEKIEKSNLKIKIKQLENEQERIEKLIEIAKPVDILLKAKNNDINQSEIKSSLCNNFDSNKKKESNSQDSKKVESDSASSNNSTKSSNNIKITKPKLDTVSLLKKKEVSFKETQKIRQASIIEAIEREKLIEKKQQMKQKTLIDEDFIDWLPPSDQSGDGRTHLNEKLGY